jgi:hypothetical protein
MENKYDKISIEVEINASGQQQINQYKAAFDSLRGSINNLSTPISKLDGDVKKLNDSLSETKTQNDSMADSVIKVGNTFDALKTIYDGVKASLKYLNISAGTLQATLTGGLSLIVAFLPEIINWVKELSKGETYTGGYGSITGDGNSAFGQAAGANLTSGSSNTFVGAGVGVMVTTGSNNTVVGGNSGGSGNVNNITAFGAGAGGGSTGDNNNFIGVAAGGNPFGTGGPLSGDYNTLIGDYAGANGATAEKNIAIGYGALTRMLSASSNIAIGYGAGWHTNSGDLTTNSNSIYIGSDTKPLANGDSNEVAIGYQAIGLGSDTTVIGNDSTTLTGIYGMLSGMADNRSLYDDNSYIQKGYADDTYGAIAGADINVNNEWHFNQHLWSETGLYIRSRTSSHYWVN